MEKMTIERQKLNIVNKEEVKPALFTGCAGCGTTDGVLRKAYEFKPNGEAIRLGKLCDPCLEKRHEGMI